MPQSLKQSPPGSVASIGGTTEPTPSVRTTDTGYKDSTGSKQTRIDVTNTNYRSDVLASNRFTLKSATTPLPVNVAAVVNKFVFEQGSSEMDDTTATENRDKIIQLGEDAEAESSHGFLTMDILPSKAAEKTLKRVQQMPFTNAVLPRAIIPDGLSVGHSNHIRTKTRRCVWLYNSGVYPFSTNYPKKYSQWSKPFEILSTCEGSLLALSR